jgi:hypothetical protein
VPCAPPNDRSAISRSTGRAADQADTDQATRYLLHRQPVGDLSADSRNTCYIEWSYLYVTASTSQYIISMTVSIDNRLVAYHSGFFQTYMYIPSDMMGRGFNVACGPRSANGLGKSYAYTLRARETGGLGAANYGSVTCPGVYLVYAPLIKR